MRAWVLLLVAGAAHAATLRAPEFRWEAPPGVEYIELICNGQSIGWRLAADGLLTPRAMDFPDGNYLCSYRAYDSEQVSMGDSEAFAFTVDTSFTLTVR